MDVWPRIEEELQARRDAHGRPVAWLAKKLGVSLQTVNNWRTRGVPSKMHKDVAAALGWSVDRLLGREALPDLAWPFELISRRQWDMLTERQRGAVETAAVKALRDLPDLKPTLNQAADKADEADKRH